MDDSYFIFFNELIFLSHKFKKNIRKYKWYIIVELWNVLRRKDRTKRGVRPKKDHYMHFSIIAMENNFRKNHHWGQTDFAICNTNWLSKLLKYRRYYIIVIRNFGLFLAILLQRIWVCICSSLECPYIIVITIRYYITFVRELKAAQWNGSCQYKMETTMLHLFNIHTARPAILIGIHRCI